MKNAFGDTTVTDELALNYHLMHPGEDSAPGDPNAAFYLDGIYHLHYILRFPWQKGNSFAFVHVTSQDMLHWTWQTTKLQPSFTGHGMFSGTGFLTKDGKPAIIYHGQASGRNQIVIAKDNQLTAWEKPYPVNPKTIDGKDLNMHHWDPDCFLINDTYYAISGGQNPPLLKSNDLKNWTYVGDFLKYDLPDVAIGEDISCPNFFPLGERWMLLCISHQFGCRYYLGDFDVENEQFIPESHGRMNWRRPRQSIYNTNYNDFFAPESVLTPDGRRVMWAWLCTLNEAINQKTIQSLPRELSIGEDGNLRIKPLRELEKLRFDCIFLSDVQAGSPLHRRKNSMDGPCIAELDGDAFEIRIIIDREEALKKRFGLRLFSDKQQPGLEVMVRPETDTLRLGDTDAPFKVSDLPAGEDVELRIFIDKYLIEVFANNRQAILTSHMDYKNTKKLMGYSFWSPVTLKSVEIWQMKVTNQDFFEARNSRIWEPEIE
jgi:sucrose-6-phosphate hydrolase SacC (GH32 family)